MYLIEILLPLYDNDKVSIEGTLFEGVQEELTAKFGGVTAHMQAPAQGRWKEEDGGTDYDQIVIFEVMASELDRAWWAAYRTQLEARFRQEKVVVRATRVEQL